MSKKNKQDKKARKDNLPYYEYGGKYVCRIGDFYRVKNNPSDCYAVHHSSFDSAADAEGFVDAMKDADIEI